MDAFETCREGSGVLAFSTFPSGKMLLLSLFSWRFGHHVECKCVSKTVLSF